MESPRFLLQQSMLKVQKKTYQVQLILPMTGILEGWKKIKALADYGSKIGWTASEVIF